MNRLLALLPMLFASLVLQVAGAKTDPETDESRFVRLTQHLENHPLSDTDKSIRSWLIEWTAEAPDITVVVCDVLGTASEEDLQNGAIYTTQMIFGNAAYQIAHPDARVDLLATQIAGVRSALKAYSSILAAQPEARIPHFDDLITKDKSGNLERYMAPIVAEECQDSGGA